MSLRIWHKLSRLIDFPRRVLMELEEIRRAQTRLNDELKALKNALEETFKNALNDKLEGLKNALDETFRNALDETFKNALDETRRRTITDLKEETAKAQTNLDEIVKNWTALATSRFENFFRLSVQNQDSSNELVAGIKRRMDDYAGATESAIKDLQDTVRSNQPNKSLDPPIVGHN
jgi:predicted phage gp36 major capsid-like protein